MISVVSEREGRRHELALRLGLAVILFACVIVASTGAQAAADLLVGDAKEQALLTSLDHGKLVRAREEAEKILRHKPRSIIARYALARVFHEEEANLPRALFHLRKVEAQLLAAYGDPPKSPRARSWHRRILRRLAEILGEMDKRRAQLATLARYDSLYKPSLERLRIWPLMKLHRFDEAIKIARKATLSSKLNIRIAGYNGLLSIEFERERPEACFRVSMQAVSATAERSCILDLNTAESAFAVFRFGDVERLALKSIQAPIKDCPSSAHPHLANLYLLRADFQRAIAAVKDARKQGVARRLRQQFEMSINAWLMRLLYALGRFKKSYDLSQRVLRRPDRVGMISYSKELIETIYTVDHYAALTGWEEQLREKASARPTFAALGLWAQAKKLELLAWALRRKASRLLSKEHTLTSLLRPYLKPMPSWELLSLAKIAGAGVTRRALLVVRERARMPQVEAYLEAVEVALADEGGRPRETLRLARRVFAKLPKDEVLLRGHIHALAAKAALSLGDKASARRHFHRVLHDWPTALRIHHVRLPVRISATSGRLVHAVAEKLRDSRRLVLDKDKQLGFTVRVEAAGRDGVRTCLHGAQGRRYACVTTGALKKLADDDARVAKVIDDFHQKLFAPLIDLTQRDINSLDGSAVRGSADQLLESVLGKGR